MNPKILLTSISGVNLSASIITGWQWVKLITAGEDFGSEIFTSLWFYTSLAFLLIGVVFVVLLSKINTQRKQIDQLIIETNKMKNESSVATLHGHSLAFSHLKYQLSKFYNNNISLSLFSINNKICSGGNARRDSTVTMELMGVCLSSCHCFKFVITGQSVVRAEDLKMTAKDIMTNESLHVVAENIGSKNEVKEFRLSFKHNGKKPNEPLHIIINWTWPNMLDLTNDFITLPNYFSKHTQAIRLSLEKDNYQSFKSVAVYKYTPFMEKPEFICDIEVSKNKFVFDFENPDMNTDYIMYYN